MPRDRRPAIPIIAPSFTVSPESYLCDTPTDSAPPANGAVAGVVEGEGAPSLSTPALSGVTPTNPPPDSPTPTHPSTSASVSSVMAPPTTSISDPQVASSVAAFNAREDAHDLNTPAEPPDKPSLPPPDKVTGLAPPSHGICPLSQATSEFVAASDSPHRPAII
jgi:hypothetical protein